MIYRLILLCCLSPMALAADLDLGVVGSADDAGASSKLVVTDRVIVGKGAECDYVDDARLLTIDTVIDDIKSGKKLKPLKITLQTYLELDQSLIAALSKNVVLLKKDCKAVPIIGGKVARPFKVGFFELFPVIESALDDDDAEKLKFIKSNVKVDPLDAEEMLTLVTKLDYDAKQVKLLEKIFRVKSLKIGSDRVPRVYMIAIYQKLGGKIKDRKDKIYYHDNLRNRDACFFTASSDSGTLNERMKSILTGVFNRMGLKVVNIGEDLEKFKQIKGIED